jgi:hypothetical protein
MIGPTKAAGLSGAEKHGASPGISATPSSPPAIRIAIEFQDREQARSYEDRAQACSYEGQKRGSFLVRANPPATSASTALQENRALFVGASLLAIRTAIECQDREQARSYEGQKRGSFFVRANPPAISAYSALQENRGLFVGASLLAIRTTIELQDRARACFYEGQKRGSFFVRANPPAISAYSALQENRGLFVGASLLAIRTAIELQDRARARSYEGQKYGFALGRLEWPG